jgi:hypothetical protein
MDRYGHVMPGNEAGGGLLDTYLAGEVQPRDGARC